MKDSNTDVGSKGIARIAVSLILLAGVAAAVIGCFTSASPAQGKAKPGDAGVIEKIRESYICPGTGLSIAESDREGALCPEGGKILKIVALMVDAGWSEQEILSSMKLFVAGQSIRASVDTRGRPAIGKSDAPVTVVEFTDMQCPYCKRHHETAFPVIKEKYIDTGKVRYVQVNLPLPFHGDAHKAAQSLFCAQDQNMFWEMRAALFENQGALSVPAIKGYAGRIGMDAAAFAACLDSGKYEARVNDDLNTAKAAGINGTPGFIVGRTGDGGVVRGDRISGAQPAEVFLQAIEKELSR